MEKFITNSVELAQLLKNIDTVSITEYETTIKLKDKSVLVVTASHEQGELFWIKK